MEHYCISAARPYKCYTSNGASASSTVAHVRAFVVNMSQWCSKAVVLAVVCLPVILLSPVADTHPIINETAGSWGSSATLEVRLISLNHHQQSGRETDRCDNGTSLDEVANAVSTVASSQQRNADDIRQEIAEVRTLVEEQNNDRRLEDVAMEMRELRQLIAPAPIECATGQPTKQALFSALAGEYICHLPYA